MINGDRDIILEVVGEAIRDQIAKLVPGAQRIEFPAPVVRNVIEAQPAPVIPPIPPAMVTIDMTPVADAIDRLSTTLLTTLRSEMAELKKALVKPEREKRSLRVTDAEGNQFTVSEE